MSEQNNSKTLSLEEKKAAVREWGEGRQARRERAALRDEFAGNAMQGFLSGHIAHCGHDNHWPYDALASEAYDMADAMLRAREGGAA